MRDEEKSKGQLIEELATLRAEMQLQGKIAEEHRKLEGEIATLDRTASIVLNTLSIEEAYERFAAQVKNLVDFDRMSINVINHQAETLELKYTYGSGQSGRQLGQIARLKDTKAYHVLSTGKSLIKPDLTKDIEFPFDDDHVKAGVRSYAHIPLVTNGRIIGTLGLRSNRPNTYGHSEKVVLESLANQIAPAIENAELYWQTVAIIEEKETANQRLKREIEERRLAQASLQISEDRYRSLFHNAPVMILTMDLDGNVITANDVWLETLGYQIGEVVGRQVTDLLSPEYQKYAKEVCLPELFQVGYVLNVECQMIGKNRDAIDVLLSAALERDEAGQITQTVAFLVDMTQRKQTEDALRDAMSRIEEQARDLMLVNRDLTRANQAKSEFLAHVSHELRSPLNGALGFARLLEECSFGPLNPRQERFASNIVTSCTHLLQLINDIIDVSQIEAQKMELHLSNVDINECLISCHVMVAGMASNKAIKLRVNLPPPGTIIRGDDTRIKQIVINLLANAIKFTPEGGRVELIATAQASETVITVKDTGIGIELEHQQTIFDSFEQVPSTVANQLGGAGLGLALVKELVSLHNGRIDLNSSAGKGSNFTVTLPTSQTKTLVEERQP